MDQYIHKNVLIARESVPNHINKLYQFFLNQEIT